MAPGSHVVGRTSLSDDAQVVLIMGKWARTSVGEGAFLIGGRCPCLSPGVAQLIIRTVLHASCGGVSCGLRVQARVALCPHRVGDGVLARRCSHGHRRARVLTHAYVRAKRPGTRFNGCVERQGAMAIGNRLYGRGVAWFCVVLPTTRGHWRDKLLDESLWGPWDSGAERYCWNCVGETCYGRTGCGSCVLV